MPRIITARSSEDTSAGHGTDASLPSGLPAVAALLLSRPSSGLLPKALYYPVVHCVRMGREKNPALSLPAMITFVDPLPAWTSGTLGPAAERCRRLVNIYLGVLYQLRLVLVVKRGVRQKLGVFIVCQ